MFGNLWTEKRKIDDKVRKLQNKHILMRQQNILENNQNAEEEKRNLAILECKQKYLQEVYSEYQQVIKTHKDLKELLKDTKETALNTEKVIDSLAQSLNIKFPEKLMRKKIAKLSLPVPQIPIFQTDEKNQLDDKNSSEDSSDKENSKVDFEGYFSPNLQIRKSLVTDDSKLYTPAIKSQIKKPQFK